MKGICDKNGGYHFKAGVKIKQKSETKALLRIKEKILADIFDQKFKKSTMRESDSLREMVAKELKEYEEKIAEIYEGLQKPLVFRVNDMLRAKCMFASVERINQCCSDIIETLTREEYSHFQVI